MRISTRSARAPIVLLTLIALALPARFLVAQVATGNIRGTVVDSSDSVIPDVKVTLTNVNTGFARTVTTNDRGDFNAPSMPLGNYQIAAEILGFQKKIVSGDKRVTPCTDSCPSLRRSYWLLR